MKARGRLSGKALGGRNARVAVPCVRYPSGMTPDPHHRATFERLQLAVEDRFVVVKLADRNAMLPGGDTIEALAGVIASLSQNYTIVCDFTKFSDNATVTYDAVDAGLILAGSGGWILCTARNAQLARHLFGDAVPILVVKNSSLPLRFTQINVELFRLGRDGSDEPMFSWDALPTEEEFGLPQTSPLLRRGWVRVV